MKTRNDWINGIKPVDGEKVSESLADYFYAATEPAYCSIDYVQLGIPEGNEGIIELFPTIIKRGADWIYSGLLPKHGSNRIYQVA